MAVGKFDGKVFLELGTSVSSVDIVKYAKSEGAYVIVTDYLPTEKSEAKQYADETAMISTLDADALTEFAREKKVDGVFCGVSEANLLSVKTITERLGLPCYFTREQWALCQDKAEFKKLCERFEIPVPKAFEVSDELTREQLDAIEYPVIVKPVDQGAGIGIHICHNEQELLTGYRDAYEKSYAHRVVVEQYLVGDEISAAYIISNGAYRLSIMGDKYLNRGQEELLPLPDAYVYPSRHLGTYLEQLNDKVIQMFRSTGLTDGTVFVQGVVSQGNIYIFEAGLRMGGTALYRFLEGINGVNMMKALTDYALTGKLETDLSLEDPGFHGKRCCLVSLLNRGGKIARIRGVEEASLVKGVVRTVVRYPEGDTILRSGTLKQSHIRFFVICDSAQELKDSVDHILELVSVTDENGQDMLLSRFDTEKLLY